MAEQVDETVLRVAQALCEREWDDCHPQQQAHWIQKAEQGIEVLIQPSDAAVERAAQALYGFEEGDLADNWHSASSITKGYARLRARAVIAAALQDGEP